MNVLGSIIVKDERQLAFAYASLSELARRQPLESDRRAQLLDSATQLVRNGFQHGWESEVHAVIAGGCFVLLVGSLKRPRDFLSEELDLSESGRGLDIVANFMPLYAIFCAALEQPGNAPEERLIGHEEPSLRLERLVTQVLAPLGERLDTPTDPDATVLAAFSVGDLEELDGARSRLRELAERQGLSADDCALVELSATELIANGVHEWGAEVAVLAAAGCFVLLVGSLAKTDDERRSGLTAVTGAMHLYALFSAALPLPGGDPHASGFFAVSEPSVRLGPLLSRSMPPLALWFRARGGRS